MHKLLINIKVKKHAIQLNAVTNLNNNKKIPIKNPSNNKITMSLNL